MCWYVDKLFRRINSTNLNSTEKRWVANMSTAYARNGHLSDKQLAVVRDISERSSSSSSYRGSSSYYGRKRWGKRYY